MALTKLQEAWNGRSGESVAQAFTPNGVRIEYALPPARLEGREAIPGHHGDPRLFARDPQGDTWRGRLGHRGMDLEGHPHGRDGGLARTRGDGRVAGRQRVRDGGRPDPRGARLLGHGDADGRRWHARLTDERDRTERSRPWRPRPRGRAVDTRSTAGARGGAAARSSLAPDLGERGAGALVGDKRGGPARGLGRGRLSRLRRA